MSLPTPLAVILVVAGLWSVGVWGVIGFRSLRAAQTAPAAGPATGGSASGSARSSTTSNVETGAAGSSTGRAARPAATPSASSLLVVAISMTLGLATLVIGFRALG